MRTTQRHGREAIDRAGEAVRLAAIRAVGALVAALALLSGRAASAEQPGAGTPPTPDTVVATVVPERQELYAEGLSTLRFGLEIAPGWHLYAPNTAGFEPLVIRAEPAPAGGPGQGPVLAGYRIAPPPQQETAFGERVAVWRGRLEVTLFVRGPGAERAGEQGALALAIRYQACDDPLTNCLLPFTRRIELFYRVRAGRGEAALPAAGGPELVLFEEGGGELPAAPGAGGVARPRGPATAAAAPATGSTGSFGLEMLLALLAGLAVTLTPCVYPIIPVTVTYFQRQGGSRARAVPLALAYGLGILLTYTALGVGMALLGRDLGAVLGHPAVIWSLVGLFVLLALSMFGYFELALPSSLTTRLQAGGRRGGLLGALVLGLTLGLVAAPCVGPVAGGLMLVVATSGDVLFGLATFGAFGLGLALPFVGLGIFSAGLQRLPRAGAWMDSVKHAFGWVLLAFAIYFAHVALGSETALLVLVGLYLFFGGITAYLAGRARLEQAAEGTAFGTAQFGGGLLVAIAGAYFLFGPYVLPEENGLLLPPQRLFASAIPWRHARTAAELDALLAQARAERRPVFIDFTARWCIPCQQMELTTFRDPEVVRELRRFLPVRIDITDDEQAQRLKIERFASYAVPFMAFYDSRGEYLAARRIEGKVSTAELRKRLKEID